MVILDGERIARAAGELVSDIVTSTGSPTRRVAILKSAIGARRLGNDQPVMHHPELDRWSAMDGTDPEAAIQAFRQDAEGDWVAELACGHSRHIRHKPPFQLAEWVTSAEGRDAHIGAPVPCKFCRMPQLPAAIAEYKRTARFDAGTVPVALTRSHRLKRGTWGEIVVTSGRVLYVLEDDDLALMLQPGIVGRIAPERPHHVELQGDAAFYIRFLRCDTSRAG
jgi:tellurite methyltransferase